MSTKAIPEAEILAPRSRLLDDNSDAWQEFELKDVKAFLPDEPAALVSLLDATVHYPVNLTGYLEPVAKEQNKLLLQSTSQRAPLIEVSDVQTFSFGQYEDGNIGLWAGGKAGWYALKPARAYKAVWEEMVEDVKMFYWVADVYRDAGKKSHRKNAVAVPEVTATVLFKRYAKDVGNMTTEEAKREVHKHRKFLLGSMIAGKEGIKWDRNPLYVHLSEKFPDDHALVKTRLTGHVEIKRGSQRSPPIQQARETRQTSISSETSSLKRKRGRRPARAEAADTNYVNDSTIVEAAMTDDKNIRPSENLETRPSKPAVASTRRTRGSPTETGESEVGTPQVEMSDDEPGRYAMKGRSALRPKATKATKGAKGGKAPMRDDEDDDEDEPASSPITSRHDKPVSKSGRQRKRRISRQDVDEGIDMPSSPATDDQPTTPSDAATGAEEGSEPDSELALRLKHAPDPVQEDTWICALDGCSHKVYQASLSDSQRLIREHYALHAYDDDDRVQMVKRLQHPSLPTSHLMERVRLQAKMEGFPASRSAVGGANAHSRFQPMPVVRY